MENKLIRREGRLYFFLSKEGVIYKRLDFDGPLRELSDLRGFDVPKLLKEYFPEGDSVEDVKEEVFKAVSEGSPKRGRGRPRMGGDITWRGMRYRRKAEGLSRGSGRPKRNPEAF